MARRRQPKAGDVIEIIDPIVTKVWEFGNRSAAHVRFWLEAREFTGPPTNDPNYAPMKTDRIELIHGSDGTVVGVRGYVR